MGNTSTCNSLLRRLIVILLITSLVFTSTAFFTDGYETQAESIIITLNPNGGKLNSVSQITLVGDNYSELGNISDPVRTGYEFTGWYDLPSGGKKILASDEITNTQSHTLYAQWTPKTYKVTFKGRGGSVSKKTMTVSYGKKYGSLATAKRKGYGFIGWFTSTGEKITSKTVFNTIGNITLNAEWGKNYKITFNANGGKVSKKSKTVSRNLKYGSLPKPKWKGHTFIGWYTKKSGGTKITDTKKVTLKKDTVLYARWILTKYELKFDSRGGKASKSKKSIYYKKKYGTLPNASRKGYSFQGWYTKKSGGTRVTSKTINKQTGTKTLYARWKAKKITVKYNANGGKSSKKNKTVTFDKKYGKLPKPTRKGYKFKGWYSKKSGGTKITKSTIVKYDKNKTIYSHWAKISTLKFNYNKGKKGKTKAKNVVYSEKYGSLPSTKRAGYIFKGWYTKKSGGTKVTSKDIVKTKKNITLYAQWEFGLTIKKMYAPAKSKCRPGSALKFAGVTIHNTGNSSPTADAFNHAKYLQGTGQKKSASWHYCVDETLITQSIPENEIAWHAGDGALGFGNTRTIAIEICMNDGGDLKAATDRAAKLTAYILAKHGYKTALSGSNLFQHNHHSGKNCPEMIRKGKPYNWNTFVNKVNSYL